MEQYMVITRWNVMARDVQKVRLDDLMVPSGIKIHKLFLTAALMS